MVVRKTLFEWRVLQVSSKKKINKKNADFSKGQLALTLWFNTATQSYSYVPVDGWWESLMYVFLSVLRNSGLFFGDSGK